MVSDEVWAWLAPQFAVLGRPPGWAVASSPAGGRGDRLEIPDPVAVAGAARAVQFGPWQTDYERLTRWNADGTWARLLARAQADADAAGELDWLVAVDSTAVRVHQHGATARRTGGNAPNGPGSPRLFLSFGGAPRAPSGGLDDLPEQTRVDVLAFTGFPKKVGRQIWSNNSVHHEAPHDRREVGVLPLRVVAAAR